MPDPSITCRAERWLGRHRRLVLAMVVVAAIVVRLGYLVELSGGPLLDQHRWIESDMHFFDAWGRRVAAGDLLTARPLHPLHDWHREVAAAWLAGHPAARVELDPRDPARALWDQWFGGRTFHQEPLYAYLIAGAYALGGDASWMLGLQLALGVLSTALIHLLARRHLGHLVAAVAGALAVSAAPLLMYDLVLIRTTPVTCAALGLTWVTGTALARPSLRRWCLTGLAFGVALLLQVTLAPLLAGPVGGLLVHRGAPRRRLAWIVALLAGIALGVAPAVARNVALGVPPLALSSVGPTVFVLSNAADYVPGTGFAVSEHTARILGTTGGRLIPVVRETLGTHESVGGWLRQLGAKLGTALHWYEPPNNTSFYYYRLHSKVLAHLPMTFAVLGPLGLVGIALALRSPPRPWLLLVLVASQLAPMLIFYTLSRFRPPLTAALVPFAALTAVGLGEAIVARRGLRLAGMLVAVVSVGIWTWSPLPAGRPLVRRADFVAPYLTYWGPRMEAAFAARAWGPAAALLEQSLRVEPRPVREMLVGRVPGDREEEQYAAFYGMVYHRLAQARARAGDAARAAAAGRRADRLMRLGRIRPPNPDPLVPAEP